MAPSLPKLIGLADQEELAAPVRPKRPTKHGVTHGLGPGGKLTWNSETKVFEQRPVYTDELASEIIDRISGGETVAQICRSDPKRFPHKQTVIGWKYVNERFGLAYQRAKLVRGEVWAESLVDLTEDNLIDPSVVRVKFDVRKWLITKHSPLEYGDKVTVAGDANAPLRHVISIEQSLQSLSEPELLALERFNNEILAAREVDSNSTEDNKE